MQQSLRLGCSRKNKRKNTWLSVGSFSISQNVLKNILTDGQTLVYGYDEKRKHNCRDRETLDKVIRVSIEGYRVVRSAVSAHTQAHSVPYQRFLHASASSAPPYSRDFSLADFFSFIKLKPTLKGFRFQTKMYPSSYYSTN